MNRAHDPHRHRGETTRRPSRQAHRRDNDVDDANALGRHADDVFADVADAAETPMWGRNEQASAETFTNDSETVRVDRAADNFHVVHGDQLAGHYGGKGDVEHGYGNEPHAVRADASTRRRGSKRR